MPQTLIGRQIIGCVNLGEKYRERYSQFFLVGFADINRVISLITVDPKVSNEKKCVDCNVMN